MFLLFFYALELGFFPGKYYLRQWCLTLATSENHQGCFKKRECVGPTQDSLS